MPSVSAWFKGLVRMKVRKNSYQQAFGSPAGRAVLEDLAPFCRARQSTFRESEREHCVLEGRREVWLRIMSHLGLSEEELMDLYSGMQRPTTEEE